MKRISLIITAVLFSSAITFAQSTLRGRVNSGLSPVPFAAVTLSNTQFSSHSNSDGEFIFTGLKDGDYLLLVRAVGYSSASYVVHVSGNTSFNADIKASGHELDEVVVNATRTDKNSGIAYNNVDSKTLKELNMGQDAPYLLNQLPAVVVNSDAGNGVGYTGIRIRGSDGTRINVTINGVPVNDAESQGTFFVDMPDLASSVNNIQVQRGVGSSVNGAGAFGASINFQTTQLRDSAYANVISTAGSFNTFRNTIAAGTGLINNHFTFDARASRITSNGYVDRASSALNSFYLSGGYYGKKSVLKLIHFAGFERTYQAWNLVPEDSIRAGNRTYNEIGGYYDAAGQLKFYPDETDNYLQHNSQLHFISQLSSKINFNFTAHYTKGSGYYEQFKADDNLADYKIPPVITSKGDTIATSDIVRRRWLNNDFAGALFNVNYTPSGSLALTAGGGYNTYFGRHYGNVIWARNAGFSDPNHRYYFNTANKNDANLFLKINYRLLNHLNIYVDAQARQVQYRFLGLNDSLFMQQQQKEFLFFNPKAGLSFDLDQHINLYASVAIAHKEPNRDDYVNNRPSARPGAEKLTDFEGGVRYHSNRLTAAVNLYNMIYRNQLVLNGRLSDVGAPLRINVPSSFRRGIEMEAGTALNRFIHLQGNICLSQNKISDFTEYTDSSYVSQGEYILYEQKKVYHNTDIVLSPRLVSSAIVTFRPFKSFTVSIVNKQVGRQYLDNSSLKERSINPYNSTDVRFNYSVHTSLFHEITFMLSIYNVFSRQYETNGYTYGYYVDGNRTTVNYLAPAAPVNFLGGINLRF